MAMPGGNPNQPRGVTTPGTTAGSFKTYERGESDLTLPAGGADAVPPSQIERLFGDAARHEALLKRGYVPPTFFASATDTRSTKGIELWHQQAALAAGHDPAGDKYPRIPDDWTPRRRAGQALSGRSVEGNRRAGRYLSRDNDVEIRTFSRSTIKAWAQETGGSTITVPIEASQIMQDGSRRPIRCDVLITTNGAGVWSVEPLGVEGTAKVKIAEAMAARLEGRRAQQGYKADGDLIERARQRELRQGVAVKSLNGKSEWVSALAYAPGQGIIYQTSSGKAYTGSIDKERYDQIEKSTSVGAMINRYVKGSGGFEVQRCTKGCGRFVTAASQPHVCPVAAKVADQGRTYATAESQKAFQTGLAAAVLRRRQAATRPSPIPGQFTTSTSTGGGADPKAPAAHRDARSSDAAPGREPVAPPAPEVVARRDQFLALWRAAAAPGHDGQGLLGPRGYTRTAARIIAPLTTQRSGDMAVYDGLSGAAAKNVLDSLPDEARRIDHNGAPPVGTLLAAAAAHPGRVSLGGHMVLPNRPDERVSVDTVVLHDQDVTGPAQAVERLRRLGIRPRVAPTHCYPEQGPDGQKRWRLRWG